MHNVGHLSLLAAVPNLSHHHLHHLWMERSSDGPLQSSPPWFPPVIPHIQPHISDTLFTSPYSAKMLHKAVTRYTQRSFFTKKKQKRKRKKRKSSVITAVVTHNKHPIAGFQPGEPWWCAVRFGTLPLFYRTPTHFFFFLPCSRTCFSPLCCTVWLFKSPNLYVLYIKILFFWEHRVPKCFTGVAPAVVKVSVQPQAKLPTTEERRKYIRQLQAISGSAVKSLRFISIYAFNLQV